MGIGLNLTRLMLTAIVKSVSSLCRRSTTTALGLIPAAAMLLLGGLLLAGCSRPTAGRASLSETVEVTVFAAASLTDVFQEAAQSFSREVHTGNVVFNFAGSQQLAGQLREGARADIFASADEMQMQAAIDAGRIGKASVKTFACNRLMIGFGRRAAGPSDGAPEVESLLKLAQPGLKIVVGAEAVPIGQYTRQFLAKAAQDERLAPNFVPVSRPTSCLKNRMFGAFSANCNWARPMPASSMPVTS